MKAILSTLAIIAALTFARAGSAEAEPGEDLTSGDRTAIRDIIGQQLDAFREDDAERAFRYAAPGVKLRFRTPAIFMKMVRESYRPVYRSRAVEFGSLEDSLHGPVQAVFLLGPNGAQYVALYVMERQDSGEWRIGGCLLQRLEGRAI